MKTKRNLSGIYFRSKNVKTGKFDNIVFEELAAAEQDKILENKTDGWMKEMIKILADTINKIGDQFDIASK